MNPNSPVVEHNSVLATLHASPDFPTLREGAAIVFTDEELQRLKQNLSEEKITHAKYLRSHPEIDAIMQCAMFRLLEEKPEDPVSVLMNFFATEDLHALAQSGKPHT